MIYDRSQPDRTLPLLPGQRPRAGPQTVRAYAGDVGRFLDWLDGEDDDLLDMHPLLLGRWVAHLTKAGKPESTDGHGLRE